MRVVVDMHFLQDKYQGIRTNLSGLYESVCRISKAHEFAFIFSRPDAVSDYWGQYGDVAFVGECGRGRRLSYAMSSAVGRLGHADLCHFSAVVPAFIPGRVMVTIHDILFLSHPKYFSARYRWQQRAALGWALRRANIVTAVSRYTRAALVQHRRRLSKPVHILPNGVSGSAVTINKASSRDYVKLHYGLDNFFLTVGRIDPRKNHEKMLGAFRLLSKRVVPGALPTFVIVGDIDNKYHEGGHLIESFAHELPILWLRNIDDETLRQLYGAARWVVMASYAEGFGLPILEAMAAGTAVVVGNNTAMPEVAGGSGILVDADSVESIAAAYMKLLMDDEFRRKVAVSGRQLALKRTWDRSAEAYLRILGEVGT